VYLIVGLGNPGPAYENTRHSIGFQVIFRWSQELGIPLTRRRFQSRFTRTVIQGKRTLLLCPETFMNLSGNAVRAFVDYYGMDYGSILVVHDDLDLPAGRIKVARKGGSGGHKGLDSLIRHLGTGDFPRMKIGIGRPRYGEPVEDFVLAPFYRDQKDVMERVVQEAVRTCELFVLDGVESAMNTINCQNFAN
jgi:peptidyl-tRNA hydrolase, PTH1 family